MESARCGIGNPSRADDFRPAMLPERFKERIVHVDISANCIVAQRTHAKEFTAATDNFDPNPWP